MKRIDGQIWIDRKAPYRLKYHINGVDYIVQVAADYYVDTGEAGDSDKVLAGMVVRDADKPSTIKPAEFPQDIDRVLGLALNDSDSENDGHIAVAQSGLLILDTKEKIQNAFALDSDLDLTLNGWGQGDGGNLPGIGCPVYWFIGTTVKEGESYKYIDSEEHKGAITFITPSGYKYPKTLISDTSLNVSYDNLPRIGTVVDYEVDRNILSSITINVNFSTFDSSLEWNWPGEHFDDSCGKVNHKIVEGKANNELVIRHGLFADNPNNLQVINYSDIVASDTNNKGSIYKIETRAENITSGNDRKTIFDIFTPEDLYYRISGEVHYNFDRNHGGTN